MGRATARSSWGVLPHEVAGAALAATTEGRLEHLGRGTVRLGDGLAEEGRLLRWRGKGDLNRGQDLALGNENAGGGTLCSGVLHVVEVHAALIAGVTLDHLGNRRRC